MENNGGLMDEASCLATRVAVADVCLIPDERARYYAARLGLGRVMLAISMGMGTRLRVPWSAWYLLVYRRNYLYSLMENGAHYLYF